ncbi:MAG: glycoside hydrolase family 32 protein [Lachnospiraceae bacterium]|jgi:beta-fructofuranosidase|nr:glycoside hydrolase family 32 protein [Lachnospiraceae bacterium]GFI31448.1 beta-fructosidase [Lachnospiraceae bacterium]
MNTGGYTKLEIFARAVQPGGKIRVISIKNSRQEGAVQERASALENCREVLVESGYYRWLKLPMEQDTEYEILCEECQVSLCYLSGSEDILETGVCYLEQEQEGGRFVRADQEERYHSPIREAYHFAPWKNWLNDPNGLCWFQGYYHMFYQFNPHSQQWSHMYWGHAASKDLVHWIHLPVVLEPQEEILQNPGEQKGGAFSGSAVVHEGEAVFFLTRSSGPRVDGEDTLQQQWKTTSRDMLHFSEEKLVIDRQPQGASFDFRDPKVFRAEGKWYMVLGSALDGKAAILLYESEDLEHWAYTGPLLVEHETGIRCVECPDLMELDGKYLAVGALMHHYDSWGRYQMCRYYVGDFQDGIFTEEHRGWFDFGSNCYAMQSFEHKGRRISIGWVSDFYGEHLELEQGACGSMTLPRELHIRDNRLYAAPVRELESLKGESLYRGQGEPVCLKGICPNTYKAELELEGNIPFSIQLGGDEERQIMLNHDETGLYLQTKGVKSESVLFPAEVDRVEKLEIFTDRRTVEVYVNDGEAVGTKLFYDISDQGCFILNTEAAEGLKRVEIFRMKSIWTKRR